MKLATLCYVKQEGKTLMVHRIKKAGVALESLTNLILVYQVE